MSEYTTPRLYVGTYAKYNNGSIKGAWLNLDDYSDKDAFLEACKELHTDEADPEFMFQDYEGFPRCYYNESHVPDALWEWIELDDDDKTMLEAYIEQVDQSGDIDKAREAFMGKADTKAAFAEQWLEDTCALEGVPDVLKRYFDYEAYARDMEHEGITFVRLNGELWVFNNN
jgi:antirestriction protein